MAGFVSEHIWAMHGKHRYLRFVRGFRASALAPGKPQDAGGLCCTGLCGTISKALAHLALLKGLCGVLCGIAGSPRTYAGTCLTPSRLAWTECIRKRPCRRKGDGYAYMRCCLLYCMGPHYRLGMELLSNTFPKNVFLSISPYPLVERSWSQADFY